MGRKRQTERAMEMYRWYCDGYSMEQVAQVFGITRQTVYDIFRRHELPRREKKELPFIEYGEHRYTPDPDGYYRRTDGDRHYLHHRIWIESNGPIAAGYEIHHRDQDKQNNALGNLTCLTASEHGSEHKPFHETPERYCLYCGAALTRKRQPSGRLETPAEVARRLYCDSQCKGRDSRGQSRGNRKRKPAGLP